MCVKWVKWAALRSRKVQWFVFSSYSSGQEREHMTCCCRQERFSLGAHLESVQSTWHAAYCKRCAAKTCVRRRKASVHTQRRCWRAHPSERRVGGRGKNKSISGKTQLSAAETWTGGPAGVLAVRVKAQRPPNSLPRPLISPLTTAHLHRARKTGSTAASDPITRQDYTPPVLFQCLITELVLRLGRGWQQLGAMALPWIL